LNVLGGYAAHDHRAMAYQAKKAYIGIPALTVRNGDCRVDEYFDPTPSDSHRAALRNRGMNRGAIISLLERR